MSRQLITKTQKSKSSALHPAVDFLHRKRPHLAAGAALVATQRSSGQHVNKPSPAGTASNFSHDFSKIPVKLHSRYPIQAKLRIGQPNDKYEQEADRVVEQVMRMSALLPSSSVSGFPLTNNAIPVKSDEPSEPIKKSVIPSTRIEVKNTVPNSMPKNTPAWSQSGKIGVGPPFFQAEHSKRSEILRHEYLHSTHQNFANVDNSYLARTHAESIASGEIVPSIKSLSVPAPSLLAFPVQTHQPWDKVYIGNAGIIGELVQGGLTLRVKMAYKDFGIVNTYKYDQELDMDLIDEQDFSIYHCGKHPNKTLAKIVTELKKVLSKVEQLNKKIPSSSTFSIQYIFISENATERYRTANNKGILFLNTLSLNTSLLDAAVHEASHGIFEHHATAGDKDPSKRIPDNLALRVSDIFTRLRATKSATMPKKKFNPKDPPAYEAESGSIESSGIIPIHDTVWSGSGGHPTTVDEFFASAFAAFVQAPKLLQKIINYYSKHDKSIKPIYAELLGLFKKIGNPKALESITEPKGKKEALDNLGLLKAPPDYTDPSRISLSDEVFFNPTSLIGPDKINCNKP